jgi:hypothetical protein
MDNLRKDLRRLANYKGDAQTLSHLGDDAAERIEKLEAALCWIARRDNPHNPPTAMLDPNYIASDQVRQLAHDMLACARAALEQAANK